MNIRIRLNMEQNQIDVRVLTELIEQEARFLDLLDSGMNRVIVGQM